VNAGGVQKKKSRAHLALPVGYDADGGLYWAVSMKSKKSRLIREEGDIFGSERGDTKFVIPCFYKRERKKERKEQQSRPGVMIKQTEDNQA
jgi:hypothetical protein